MIMLKGNKLETQTKAGILALIERLKEGNKVQESSTNLMKHLIQDLLDYAQIRAGKFRKNLKNFNIKSAVNEIVQMQKKKAQS